MSTLEIARKIVHWILDREDNPKELGDTESIAAAIGIDDVAAVEKALWMLKRDGVLRSRSAEDN